MRLRFLVAPLAVAALLVVPASAKEGVVAKLDNRVSLKTAAGEAMTVRWHLVDADGGRFGAGGIYLRVYRCGRPSHDVTARVTRTGYSARFRVRRGGIRKLVVGLQGWRMYPSGRRERADVYFPFDPPLRRTCG